MSKEETEAKLVEQIEYEKYSDAFAVNKKKGMFSLSFGQSDKVPAILTVKIWLDTKAMKDLSDFLQKQIKDYEKTYGKIE